MQQGAEEDTELQQDVRPAEQEYSRVKALETKDEQPSHSQGTRNLTSASHDQTASIREDQSAVSGGHVKEYKQTMQNHDRPPSKLPGGIKAAQHEPKVEEKGEDRTEDEMPSRAPNDVLQRELRESACWDKHLAAAKAVLHRKGDERREREEEDRGDAGTDSREDWIDGTRERERERVRKEILEMADRAREESGDMGMRKKQEREAMAREVKVHETLEHAQASMHQRLHTSRADRLSPYLHVLSVLQEKQKMEALKREIAAAEAEAAEREERRADELRQLQQQIESASTGKLVGVRGQEGDEEGEISRPVRDDAELNKN